MPRPSDRRRQRTGQPGAYRYVTAPHRRKAPPPLRGPRGPLGRPDMARELRALLLWGRRLSAPTLAASSRGEGRRAAGGDARGPQASGLRGRRGDGTTSPGFGDSVKCMRQARREQRTPSAQRGLGAPGPARRRAALVYHPGDAADEPGARDSCRAPRPWGGRRVYAGNGLHPGDRSRPSGARSFLPVPK